MKKQPINQRVNDLESDFFFAEKRFHEAMQEAISNLLKDTEGHKIEFNEPKEIVANETIMYVKSIMLAGNGTLYVEWRNFLNAPEHYGLGHFDFINIGAAWAVYRLLFKFFTCEDDNV